MKLAPKLPIILASASLSLGQLLAADHAAPSVSPDAALSKLRAGNARFVSHAVSAGKPSAERRAASAKTQHPFAVIIGCADSRTSPELIFDQNIGDLFVIRTAGNLVDDYALGSIEYAVEHLGTRLIVVLGHERCGAVGAAVESGSAPGHVGALVHDIRPAVNAVHGRPGDTLENAIDENAARVAAKIRHKAQLGAAAAQVRVVKGHYDLDSGKVAWLAD
jgi:carbonic anhydrase